MNNTYRYIVTLEKPFESHYKVGSIVLNKKSNNKKFNNKIVALKNLKPSSLEASMADKGFVNNIYNYGRPKNIPSHTHPVTPRNCNIQDELDLRIKPMFNTVIYGNK